MRSGGHTTSIYSIKEERVKDMEYSVENGEASSKEATAYTLHKAEYTVQQLIQWYLWALEVKGEEVKRGVSG